MKILTLVGILFVDLGVYLQQVHTYCSSNHRCKCKNIGNEVKALCAGKNITISPHFAQNVTDIDLSSNQIKETPNRKDLPHKLKRLDLSSNPISSILEDSFQNLHHLEVLNLENTKEIPRVPSTIFKDLTSLKSLNIKNKLPGKLKGYPIDILMHVPSLESLSLNGNNERFQEDFRKLVSLQTLDISGRGGYCDLSYIGEDYFENVGNITTLNISNCRLKNLLKGTFSSLHQLTELDISHNEELSFTILRNLTSDLTTTKIKILRMNKIHCTFGLGTMMYRSDVIALQNTSLREIYVDSNRMQLIQTGVLRNLPKSLQYASFADNILTFGWYAFEVAFLKNLKTYNMSLQFLSHTPTDILPLCDDQRTKRSEELSTDMEISDAIKAQSFQITLLSPVNSRYSNQVNTVKFNITLPKSFEIGYFNRCDLYYMVPGNDIGKNNIKEFYLQDNYLYEWIGPVRGVHTLQVLDMSNNFCTNMSTYFFDYFTGLKTLKINDNILGFTLSEDVRGLSFKTLRNLTRLEVAANKIQKLPSLIFKNLFMLRTLILKSNLLTDLAVDLKHMTYLRHVDLSHNMLSELNSKTRNDLDIISNEMSRINSSVSVNLTGNLILCNCENIEFVRWLVKTDVKVKFEKSDSCQSKFHKDGRVPLHSISTFLPTLEKNCKSYTILIVAGSSVIMISLTIIICGLVYRYRWKLRFLYYMTKARYSGRIPREHDDQYEYDAFISYADEDRMFGFHQMRQKVAEEGNLRLCFHSIDFIPGVDIAENITTAIHSSRKTICVISQDYMNSYWCKYELNMARMESIYSRNGQNVLFLVFYKQCDVNPTILLDLIESQTYIEYPNDKQGDVVFWDTLRRTIATSV